jgi:hypothetical protein
MLDLIINAQRHREAEEAARRKRDVRADLAAAMREWFAHVELARLEPNKDQPSDTVLGGRIGLPHTGELLNKGFAAMQLYAAITKVVPQSDGTIKVYGIASTPQRDDQNEVITADAVRQALPKFMQYPALREMHQLSAAGTVLECETGEDGITRVVAHVVDLGAVVKVRNRVYRGFSLGGNVLERDPSDPRTITRLAWNELSLVDRPANPQAKVEIWKASWLPQPQPCWDCGAGHQHHTTKQAAAQCRVERSIAEVKAKSKADKRQKQLDKALAKAAGRPSDPVKQVAEILSRPIVPDSNDMAKRATAYQDFRALYYAGRQQLVGPRYQR